MFLLVSRFALLATFRSNMYLQSMREESCIRVELVVQFDWDENRSGFRSIGRLTAEYYYSDQNLWKVHPGNM